MDKIIIIVLELTLPNIKNGLNENISVAISYIYNYRHSTCKDYILISF